MLIPLPNRIESDTSTYSKQCRNVGYTLVLPNELSLSFRMGLQVNTFLRPRVCYLRFQMMWHKTLAGRLRCVAHSDPLYSS